jgi:hypothetical protein
MPDIGTPVSTQVGFADSNLGSYAKEGDTFVVRVTAWNECTLLVEFSDVIGVRDQLAGSFSGLVADADLSASFLEAVLQLNYEAVPREHGYRVFSFLNHEELPSLEVVARRCEVRAPTG